LLREPVQRQPAAPPAPGIRSEQFALALLLRFPELRARGTQIDTATFDSTVARELFQVWLRGDDAQESEIPDELRQERAALQDMRMMASVMTDPLAALEDCLRRIEFRRVDEEKRLRTASLTDSGTTAPPEEENDAVSSLSTDPEMEAALLSDIELGQRLHRLEYRLRTGRPPKALDIESAEDAPR